MLSLVVKVSLAKLKMITSRTRPEDGGQRAHVAAADAAR